MNSLNQISIIIYSVAFLIQALFGLVNVYLCRILTARYHQRGNKVFLRLRRLSIGLIVCATFWMARIVIWIFHLTHSIG